MQWTEWSDYIGYAGAFFTAVNFLPQVIKAYKTKNVDDLSTLTLLLILMGQTIWIFYGIAKNLLPVIISNACLLTLAIILFILKFYYQRKGKHTKKAHSA